MRAEAGCEAQRYYDANTIALASPINLTPMPDGYHQHHEPLVLDGGDNTIIANAVTPKSLAVAGRRTAEAARVVAAGDTLAQIAQHPPFGVNAKLAQVAGGGAIELDTPG